MLTPRPDAFRCFWQLVEQPRFLDWPKWTTGGCLLLGTVGTPRPADLGPCLHHLCSSGGQFWRDMEKKIC